MMHLAFVTSLVPLPKPDTGFEIANAAILCALREAGHRVSVFGFVREGQAHPADPDTHVLADIVIENAAASARVLAGWAMTALVNRLPLAIAKLKPHAALLPEALRGVAGGEAGAFDAIVLNSIMMPGACPALLDIAPCLLVEHNVEHLTAAENATHARNRLMRWIYRREARLLQRIEHRVAAKARFIWFLAEEDRVRIGMDVMARSAVLPLVSTTERPAAPVPPAMIPSPSPSPSSRLSPKPIQGNAPRPQYDVGLIGTWSWGPNRIGLEWFLKEVAPRLAADIIVAIAGRMPEGIISPRASVLMLGRVPDAGAFLASCRTLALASRAGTGVQLKTLEAFQLGKPAVATALSLRGFAEYPANMRLADDGRSFAAALTDLVADVRAGRMGDMDGAAFLQRQKQVMLDQVRAGLAVLKT